MADSGLRIEVFENGDWANGYQVLFTHPLIGGILREVQNGIVDIHPTYNGQYFSAYEWDRSGFMVQPVGRDPIYCHSPYPGFTEYQCLLPAFKTGVHPQGFSQYPYSLDEPHYYTHEDIFRFWFLKVELKLQWKDSSHPIPRRWVGLGPEEWTGHANQQGQTLLRWGTGWHNYTKTNDVYKDYWRDCGLTTGIVNLNRQLGDDKYNGGYTWWIYTDDSGVATYRFLVGWAWGKPSGYGSYTWTLFKPGDSPRGNLQNISLYTNRREGHFPKESYYGMRHYLFGPSQEQREVVWLASEQDKDCLDPLLENYIYRQHIRGADIDDGGNWSVPYGTAWNSSTGQLICPSPNRRVHTYQQGIRLKVVDSSGNPVENAVVTIDGISSATNANGISNRTLIPKGSVIDRFPYWMGAAGSFPPYTVPGQQPVPYQRKVPVYSTAPFTDESQGEIYISTPGESAWLLRGGEFPQHRFIIAPTTTTFQNIKDNFLAPVTLQAFDRDSQQPINNGGYGYGLDNETYFDCGEVFTLPKTIQVTNAGKTVEFKAYVHEDRITDRTQYPIVIDTETEPPTAHRPAVLDYALDMFKEPHLVFCTPDHVELWEQDNYESNFRIVDILEGTLGLHSPSQVFLEDHRRLLLVIDKDDKLQLYRSDNSVDWTTLPIVAIDDTQTYKEAVLRSGPFNSTLHLWGQREDNTLWHLISIDGGVSWSSPEDTGLTVYKGFDVVYHLDRWYLITTIDGLKFYESVNETTWTLLEAVTSSGFYPKLVIASDGTPLIIYSGAAGLLSRRRLRQDDNTYAWSAATIIADASLESKAAAFVNQQKVLAVQQNNEPTPQFYKSFDDGLTWEAGSLG
jgi:hypothetical protein